MDEAKKLWLENRSKPIENVKPTEPPTVHPHSNSNAAPIQLSSAVGMPSTVHSLATPIIGNEEPPEPATVHQPQSSSIAAPIELSTIDSLATPIIGNAEPPEPAAVHQPQPSPIATPIELSSTAVITSTIDSLATKNTSILIRATTPFLRKKPNTSKLLKRKAAADELPETQYNVKRSFERYHSTNDYELNSEKSSNVTSAAIICSTPHSEDSSEIVSTELKNTSYVAESVIEKSVFDGILEKVQLTQNSSELAHITKQAKDKHLNRANIETVNREASKRRLDTNCIKNCKDIEKYWIIATYLRLNPQIDYTNICKEAGADIKTLANFIEQSSHITCEEAMGLFPGAYKRLKEGFKSIGVNTEVRIRHEQYFKEPFLFNIFKLNFCDNFSFSTCSSTRNYVNSPKQDLNLTAF